jgi:hypothetical protein
MPVTDSTPLVPLTPTSPVDWVFPTLTPEQIARIGSQGSVRTIQRGEVLVEAGDQLVPFFVEAQLCRGEEAVVVGGGNSAGQAAVFLSQTARRVCVLVRSSGLAESMSRYLETGADLSREDLAAAHWPLARTPHLLETISISLSSPSGCSSSPDYSRKNRE